MTDEVDSPKSKIVQNDDSLSTEVSIRGKLDNSGLTLAARSRAASALDQLVGGLVGWSGAWAESNRRRAESRGRHREQMQDIKQAVELSKFRAGIELEQAAWERRVADEVRRQSNREAVGVEAVAAIAHINPPADGTPCNQEGELDQDWMDYFASYAEKASAETVRQTWGRILAGQVVEPGKFSLTALRILAELDSFTSSLFQEVVRLRSAPDMIMPPEPLEGVALMNLVHLEDIGLIQNAANPLSLATVEAIPDWSCIFGTIALRCFDIPPNTLRWPVIPITKAGQQIASILPWDQEAAARMMASRLPGDFTIELWEVRKLCGQDYHSKLTEVLRKNSPT